MKKLILALLMCVPCTAWSISEGEFTLAPSGGDYTSMAEFADALTSLTGPTTLYITTAFDDYGSVNIDVNIDDGLWIIANEDVRQNYRLIGTLNTTPFHTDGTGWENKLYIDGITVMARGNASYSGAIRAWGNFTNISITNCLIISTMTNNQDGMYLETTDTTFNIANNFVYGFSGSNGGIYIDAGGGRIVNNTSCFNVYGARHTGSSPTCDLINNIFMNNSSGATAGTFQNSANNVTTGVTFVDVDNRDLHLDSTDTTAINQGTDLSSLFTIDYDGDARPAGAWDIGADEYVSGGGTPPQILILY